MGIYFYLYPVDPGVLQHDVEWVSQYVEDRDHEFWDWEQDRAAPAGDPRSQVVLGYQHHYVDLINPYLEAAYGLEPYSWFAGDQINEFYFVTSEADVSRLAATLADPPVDVRDALDGLAQANLSMAGTWAPVEGWTDGTVEEFWDLVDRLHAQLRDFFSRAADHEQAVIGLFSP
ncbi:hypothetical protein [Antribacter gilvus]|uniref:hypothetical protein n=1 Tax=Antribacter gilvus TaxID=2304675 RepID=UPI000F778AD9|nr:hypothetical protein [Antribacter gilvus]